jgi:hypothetical protein
MKLLFQTIPLGKLNVDTDFTLFNDHTNKLQFFTARDILMTVLWVVISMLVAFYIKNLNKEKVQYNFFLQNLIFKIFFALIFGNYYLLIIQGGDTIAFWDTSVRLTNLFYYKPEFYFKEWFQYLDSSQYVNYFTPETGFPPRWIAKEQESYFVCKLFSFINPITTGSYFANTVFMALLSSIASFKLFDFVVENTNVPVRNLALYFLFIPSLAFWCTGVSKDSVILVCLYFGIPILFNLFNGKSKNRFFAIVYLIVISYILLNIRSFMLIVLIIPFLFAMNVKIVKYIIKNKYAQRSMRIFIFIVGFAFIFLYLGTAGQKFLKEAEVIQKDFQENTTYQGKKYDIGSNDYSPSGLIKAMPLSILTGIFRPFPWEALSPGLLLNGIESIILFYLFLQFLSKKPGKRFARIRDSEVLTFSLYLVMIMGFMTGFTSVIFGVLVRLRAPLLPFVILLLTTLPEDEAEDKGDSEQDLVTRENEPVAYS